MIDGTDDAQKLAAERPADERHERLEPAEEQGQHHGDLEVDLLHAQALADGHGKRVHGEARCNEQQLNKTHLDSSLGGTPPVTLRPDGRRT